MTNNELELRASLESALVLLRRLGQLEHAEDCDHYNACQNAECECPEDDDGCVTHETASCTCLVFDAAHVARNVSIVLARTMPKATPMPSAGDVEDCSHVPPCTDPDAHEVIISHEAARSSGDASPDDALIDRHAANGGVAGMFDLSDEGDRAVMRSLLADVRRDTNESNAQVVEAYVVEAPRTERERHVNGILLALACRIRAAGPFTRADEEKKT